MTDIPSVKMDFLKEVANIGLGNAATSLSKMIDSRVDISLPELNIIPCEHLLSKKSKKMCAVKTGIEGEAKGAIIILFDDNTSFWLMDRIIGNKEGTTSTYDEMGVSAIKEFTNIIGGSFLSSLSDFIGYNMMPRIPELFVGTGDTIKDNLKDSILKEAKDLLHVKTDIYVDKKKIQSEIFLILDNASFESMFKKMS